MTVRRRSSGSSVSFAWFVLAVSGACAAAVACGDGSGSAPDAPSVATPDAAPAPTPTPPADASTEAASDAASEAAPDAAPDATAGVQADVTKDFATAANPNGAWTYGYTRDVPTAPDAGALVVFSAVSNDPVVPSWYDPANVQLGAPAAWRNDSAAVANGVAPGEFAVHPGNAGEYAVVRWTAPAAGVYAITLQFKEGDTGDTDGLLLLNGVALVTETSTAAGTLHELQRTLAAGDRLDVAVGPKGDFRFDSTPLRFLVRSVVGEP